MAWHGDRTFVTGLQNALVEAEIITTMEELKEFHNHPYRYDDYYKSWAANNFPSDEDDDGWDEFVSEINAFGEDDDEDEEESEETDETEPVESEESEEDDDASS